MSATAVIISTLAASTILLVLMITKGQMTTRTSAPSLYTITTSDNEISSDVLLDDSKLPVKFVLFARNQTPYLLQVDDPIGFQKSGFNINNPTKIVVHGFLSSIKEDVFVLTKNAYLMKGNYNVIGMDWSVLCEFEYFSAVRGAQLAGHELSNFLDYLTKLGVQGNDIHLIGHSLGAHVAAMGAKGKVERITGLDPAGPGYSDVSRDLRLDPGDAVLVDVIHTYMRILSLSEPLGHVDFYPNGGIFQPGCPEFYNIWKLQENIDCNHGRAYLYFVESIINPQAFKSARCSSVQEAIYGQCTEETDVYMGQAETYRNGLYYVKTNEQPPFSQT